MKEHEIGCTYYLALTKTHKDGSILQQQFAHVADNRTNDVTTKQVTLGNGI